MPLAGCFNARDLGGIPVSSDGFLREQALVRADSIDRLTDEDWTFLLDQGVRTIVDLRNADERSPEKWARPSEITTHHLALDGSDEAFWAEWGSGPQFGTALYYRPHLEAFPELSVAVLQAIAHAPPGGVLVHCSAGRDRTGQTCMLLLRLLGAADEVIVADYLAGEASMPALFEAQGKSQECSLIAAYLDARGMSRESVFRDVLDWLNAPVVLAAGGFTDADLAALRARLVG